MLPGDEACPLSAVGLVLRVVLQVQGVGVTWNFRALKYEDGTYGVHEVFYDDGEPWGCTEHSVGPVGDDLDEILDDLARMVRCLKEPVLEYSEIGDDRVTVKTEEV